MYPCKPIKILKQNFDHPHGICYDEWNHHIIVSDYNHHCIKWFDSTSYQFDSYFGSQGNEIGQFDCPIGLCIQPFTHYLLICDTCNNRIQVLSKSNDDYFLLYQIGSTDDEGSKEKGQFDDPRGICCDNKGHILVADTWNDRIQEFNESGRFLHSFGSYGQSLNQFYCPHGICNNKQHHQLLIADTFNNRVSIWSHDPCSKPQYISQIQLTNQCYSVCVNPLQNHQIYIGTERNVLIYDSRKHKEPIQTLGTYSIGLKIGEFHYVVGLCINEQDGTLLVADSNNHRIQFFK